MRLSENHDCIFIKGNHDIWCEQWLQTGRNEPANWLIHGGKETIDSYASFSEEEKKAHLLFFENMLYYFIDDKNRLFLHAGFTSMYGAEKEQHQKTLTTDRTLWEMSLTMDSRIDKNSDRYPKRLQHYSEIYIGHTPTLSYHKHLPMQAATVWNADTGAAFTGKLSVINVDTKEVFQSDILPYLYPNEMGRNK